MKKIILACAFGVTATLFGCAAPGVTGNSAPGFVSKMQTNLGGVQQSNKPPAAVLGWMDFANREDNAISGVIKAQKSAGYRPMGALQTVTFVVPNQQGRQYKVEIVKNASWQIPQDALAIKSPALVAALQSFGNYVANRPEPSLILISGTTTAEVAFLENTIHSAAPNTPVQRVVKDTAPFVGFASTGSTAARILQ